MNALLLHLSEPGWLSLRDVTRLVLLSGLFTLVAMVAFPRNAASRRALLICAVVALTLLPWLLTTLFGVWTLPLVEKPTLTLSALLPNLLVWLWLGGAAVGLGWQAIHLGLELRMLAQLPPINSERLKQDVQRLCNSLDMPAPALLQGNAACSITMHTPRLILPAQWRSWPHSTLEAVLAHELVHIQRRDDRWLMAARALTTFYWWMPWLRLLTRRHERVMEESCDDAASDLLGRPLDYAQALYDVAGDTLTPHSATGMHRHHVADRIGRFSQQRALELDSGAVYWCVVAIVGVVSLITSIEPVAHTVIHRPAISVLPVTEQAAAANELTSTFPQVSETTRPSSPHTIHQVAAIYPGSAIRAGIEGHVAVRFSVSRDGSVAGAKVIQASPPGVFDEAALRAVRNTRYEPAYKTDSAFTVMRAASRPPTQVTRQFRFTLYRQ